MNREERNEFIGGLTTAIFLSAIIICIIVATLQAIFNLL